eukprot:TRINITY_DN18743_c0_g1_i1.p1 TRINITY_DN18743_c0_g1~~TRINITY_DN18743_c0_g1_i1.p1  ORF type:complete len:460 (+),score=55.65 TRINITY_DN18743_c0_g1_i1:60-1382(+)
MGVNGVPYKLLILPIVALMLIMTFYAGGGHEEFLSAREKHERNLDQLAKLRDKVVANNGNKNVVTPIPQCYYLSGTGVGDSATQGMYTIQNQKMNGKNVYLRASRAWAIGDRYLYYREDGRWAVAESFLLTAIYYTSEPVDLPGTDTGAKWAARSPDGQYSELPHYLVIAKGKAACFPVPELDSVIPEGGEVHPVQGVHYEADFDIFNPKPAPKLIMPPAPHFRYLEDVSPDLKIPYKIISYMPRVYFFERLLTDQECEAIVEHAHNQITRSGVVPHKGSNDSTISDVRTSSHTWLNEEVPEVGAVMDRILSITGFRRGDQEALQVLRYEHNQKYDAHHDYFDPNFYGKQTTNRAITAFLYLDNVEEGGETWFPRANGGPYPSNYHSCDSGLRVKPVKGSAAFFYDMRPDLTLDEYSLHGGCPVVKGTKWGGTLWLHTMV